MRAGAGRRGAGGEGMIGGRVGMSAVEVVTCEEER